MTEQTRTSNVTPEATVQAIQGGRVRLLPLTNGNVILEVNGERAQLTPAVAAYVAGYLTVVSGIDVGGL